MPTKNDTKTDTELARVRHTRVPDHIWTGACKRANEDGETISTVVRQLLRRYESGEINLK